MPNGSIIHSGPQRRLNMASEEALKEDEGGGTTPSTDGESERERSTIGFPYGDLDDAIAVAKGVQAVGGSSCDWDQLAAQLNQAGSGGGFRQRLLTAKTFGLVTYAQQRISLTPLGSQICDPKRERIARADAFLTVPLYRSVFERFRGGVLPPASGLEAEMVTLGVAKKQTGKARQVFQRSAQQANFFWSGQDRLVMPSNVNGESGGSDKGEKGDDGTDKRSKAKGGGGGGGGALHPFIQGLVDSLPEQETPFPIEKRAKWLQAASKVFDLMYEDVPGSIEIKIQKESA
jgi:hypothetical protein